MYLYIIDWHLYIICASKLLAVPVPQEESDLFYPNMKQTFNNLSSVPVFRSLSGPVIFFIYTCALEESNICPNCHLYLET